jgi:hypothetical protein
MTSETETQLREALDDLWSCIAANEIGHLHQGTIEIAAVNHMKMWHGNPRWIDGTARLGELMQRPGFAEKVEQARQPAEIPFPQATSRT